MEVVQEKPIDLLSVQTPALSSTSDMPVVETKPDAVQAEQPSQEAPAEQPEESATSATEEDSGQQSDEPRGVGKALAKLRQERREAEERERTANERLDKALQALERFNKPPEKEAEPVKPTRTEFPDQEAYDAALDAYVEEKAAWVARKEVTAQTEKARKEEQERLIEEQQSAARDAYQARTQKVRERYSDFEEVANTPDVQVSIQMAHAIIHSENGPELQYYLGKNPAEAKRIMALPEALQLMEMGKLEVKLSQLESKPKISTTPKPIKPLNGGSEPAAKTPEEESMEEYAARRRSEISAARVRH